MQVSRLGRIKRTEGGVGYFEVNEVFNGEPVYTSHTVSGRAESEVQAVAKGTEDVRRA